MPVTGAYAKLGKVVAELAALGDAKTMEMAGRNVGQAVLSEVQLGFRNEVSPNDVPWVKRKRPRKRNKGAGKLLRDTGRLGNSLTAVTSGTEVIIGTNVEYAPYHQFGTRGRNFVQKHVRLQAVNQKGKFLSKKKAAKRKAGSIAFRLIEFQAGGGKLPARPFLPLDELPPRFERAVAETIVEVLKRVAPATLRSA